MHILALPKWYPGRNDPQLGDFIRKQMLAVARHERVSVVFTAPVVGLGQPYLQELNDLDGAWELRCYYEPSIARSSLQRKVINLQRWWKATRQGIERCMRERGKPDLTHVHILVRPALAALWLKRRSGVPYILSEQSSQYLDGTWEAKSEAFQRLNRSIFRKAAAVTAVSAHLGEQLKRLRLTDAYQVVPNTVPGTDRPLPAAGPRSRFMMVADLVDRTKNISGVLTALKAVRAAGGPATLEVIGNGPDAAKLMELASELGISDHVTWHGRLSNAEVLDHMATTGTVIINSNVETFSVVTGEALALGKPVIATKCGGPQAFVNSTNGILIEPRNTQELVQAMLRMANDGPFGDPATIRNTISERFSPEVVAAGFIGVYQRVLAG